MNTPTPRRTAVHPVAASADPVTTRTGMAPGARAPLPPRLKGNIHHAACRWCYGDISLEDLCRAGRPMGLVAIDLLDPEDFGTVRQHGLVCSMVNNPTVNGLGGIPRAWNRLEHHDTLAPAYEERIRQTADAGFERLICFSGNRQGLDDEQGLEHCVIGLKRILPLAERRKVTLCMELLNSKRTHPDYQCDHTAWGVELVKRVGSERFKLLYDIYHMQIMEGDVCDTIRENHACIDHYHTGGVPGRNEIDGTQELNYPRIMQAILETGFQGYVAQEFVPRRADALGSLQQGVQLCDV